MVKLKKYRKLTGIEKMRQDQKEKHEILNLPHIDDMIFYARLLNDDQIKYMYQKLDEYYIHYKTELQKIKQTYNYIKKNLVNFNDDLLEEINELGYIISKLNYLLSDLKYLKKKFKYELDLRDSKFYTSLEHESSMIIRYKNQLDKVSDNKLIDPVEFYDILADNIITTYHTNRDKKTI